uniref:Uncharacterized protein n=1 Tax=Pristionchus pacificus TaxID=54126 RepID=A0A2A6BDL1_PRIPA|eukprot:PDM63985.1 hypothetical protein PRIPAC_49486 [Pristionchus pacificus]
MQNEEKSITLDELTSASMKSRKQEKPFFKKEKDELKKSYLQFVTTQKETQIKSGQSMGEKVKE